MQALRNGFSALRSFNGSVMQAAGLNRRILEGMPGSSLFSSPNCNKNMSILAAARKMQENPPNNLLSPSAVTTTPLLTIVRTIMRDHFPRPKETKRIRVHGWKKRLSTHSGRRIIMLRILKGRHVLSH